VGEAIRGGGGTNDVLDDIGALVEIRGRGAGTDAERRAARHLGDRLRELGRDADAEPIRIWPAVGPALFLTAVAGIVGSVLSVYVPLAGFALVLLATISAFGDLTGAFFLARMPFGARASQNVVSAGGTGKHGRLVLVASYDARRGGMLFSERLRRWPAVFFWSLVAILVCTIPRLVGLHPGWLAVIQFIPTLALILLAPLFADVALSAWDEGANWNASGVAVVLDLARRYGGSLEHFDLTVVFTGASHPTPLGMRAWLKRHNAQLDPQTTAFIVLESAGHGTPHYATKEGLVFPARLHPTLTAIAEQLEMANPFTARSASAAYAARSAGLPALRVSALGARDFAPDKVDPEALERTRLFMGELIERIDGEIGEQI
jgi:hypothetical protein